MDIYLIRHTQTDTVKGLCYGRTDVALAPSFNVDVEQVKQKLSEPLFNCQVFSSPLTRCKLLAERLSSHHVMDDRLLELDFGAWENCRFEDLDGDAVQRWTESFVHSSPPSGESFSDLCSRAADFWQELITLPVKQAVVVTHAGVIRALLAHILQLPLANAFQFKVDPGSIHKLQHVSNFTHIHYLNH